jgi:hypothetical protein
MGAGHSQEAVDAMCDEFLKLSQQRGNGETDAPGDDAQRSEGRVSF